MFVFMSVVLGFIASGSFECVRVVYVRVLVSVCVGECVCW